MYAKGVAEAEKNYEKNCKHAKYRNFRADCESIGGIFRSRSDPENDYITYSEFCFCIGDYDGMMQLDYFITDIGFLNNITSALKQKLVCGVLCL